MTDYPYEPPEREFADTISTVLHRYGDGAVALMQKVLGEIAERHRIAAEVRS